MARKRLSPEERRIIIEETICKHLQKTDRILIGSAHLGVRAIRDRAFAAGFTTGDAIKLNFAYLDYQSDEDLVALYGLNYHELAHVIMTPRLKGTFQRRWHDLQLFECFNLMEDWRIETHFATMFETAERYFNVCARILVLNDRKDRARPIDTDWTVSLFVMGRFYMDPAFRLRFELLLRDRLKGSSRRMEIDEAINMGMRSDDFLTSQIVQHYRKLSDEFAQDPDGNPDVQKANGIYQDFLNLLDLEGDERVDEMVQISREFVASKWAVDSEENNRRMISLINSMYLLMPYELMKEHKMAGMPVPGNGDGGGLYGPDLPNNDKMQEEKLQERNLPEVEKRIESDKTEMDKLRDLARQMMAQPPVDPDGPKKEVEEFDDEEEMEADTGEGGDDSAQKIKHPDKIVIDPSQGRGEDPDEDEEDDEDDEEEELGEFAGHLTAGAGQGSSGNKDEYLAQLTPEELAQIDQVFRDAAPFDEFLTDEVNQMLKTGVVQRSLRSIRSVWAEALGENLDLESNLDAPFDPVPEPVMRLKDDLQRQLEEIRSILEGTHRDEQTAGKLNIRRLINAPPSQRGAVFRSWVKDEVDEAGLELVVLLDRSSSMASAMDHASQMCWMIASAVKETGGRVHVISFSDPEQQQVLLTPGKSLHKNQYQKFGSQGNTYVASALKLARRVIQSTNMPNRVVAILTDGGWSDLPECVPILQKINATDTDTILMLMGLHLERGDRGCKHVVHVNDLERATVELRDTVRRIADNVAERVSRERGFRNE